MSSPDAETITRDQIEAKFRELTGGVTDEVEGAKSQALTVGLAVAVVGGRGRLPHRPAQRPSPLRRRRGPADLNPWTRSSTTCR